MKRIEVKQGDRYGMLTVIRELPQIKGKRYFECKCKCGNVTKARFVQLRNGEIKSCGCMRNSNNRVRSITHGLSNTRVFNIWCGMRRRCNNPNTHGYKYYGGRGIKVCEVWNNSFTSFFDWAINNGYADNLTIDRINVDGNYEPANCRWITIQEQQKNRH